MDEKNPSSFRCPRVLYAAEKRKLKYTQKMQPEYRHNQPGDDIDNCAIRLQKMAHRAGQGSQADKHQGKTGNKTRSIFQRFFHTLLFPTGKVRHIHRQHGK